MSTDNIVNKINGIVEVVPKTAQELYDTLIVESKRVFDEFNLELAKVSTPYNILSNYPQELIDLTNELITVRDEVRVVLQNHLDTNNIANLESFNFYDERGLRLQAEIESFK